MKAIKVPQRGPKRCADPRCVHVVRMVTHRNITMPDGADVSKLQAEHKDGGAPRNSLSICGVP